jgi:subtilisin family serine protease/subtilisin-like proprotein convertase family protein
MKSRNGWRHVSSLGTLFFVTAATWLSAAETWQFREPKSASYTTDAAPLGLQGAGTEAVLEVYPPDNPDYRVELTKRVVLRGKFPETLTTVLAKSPLVISRRIDDRTVVLEATDAWTAAREAARLSGYANVEVCTPVFRRPFALHGSYASRTSDTLMPNQWHLENRDANGNPAGADINIRAAWPLAKGAGVTVAVADEGVELSHPDLVGRTAGAPHKNFHNNSENGNPMNLLVNRHGTSVAGLITADTDNSLGLAGAAPLASLASWVIFDGSGSIATDEQLAVMFGYRADVVNIQNHSWGGLANQQVVPSFQESIALDDAVTTGRNGHGVVIIRAAGNHRTSFGNVNDDGYASSPNAIAVGAVRLDGRVASYGSRGSSILVSAPSGDSGFATLVSTDLTGANGYNQISFTGDQNNYVFGSVGFSGTSGSTPQISGITALMLSANPNLNLRDVQHILIQSARHYDLADPAVQTNSAGFRTSDNVGFGVPDAGVVVKLAQTWSNLPPRTIIKKSYTGGTAIPELGTKVQVLGPNVPLAITAIQAYPTDDGPRVDKPITALPLVFVGYAASTLTTNLHGKAALIERGADETFANKIKRAADAGAAFAVIFDNVTNNNPLFMDVDAFSPIPAVFIDRLSAFTLTNYLAQTPTATTMINVQQAAISFNVTETLVCEHVSVRLTANHPARADLRITLVSPAGTVSTLQAVNNSVGGGPTDWTYYSTQNFYESSKGLWTIQVTDELTGSTGLLTDAELSIYGIPITDTDGDGLDDAWEMANFGTLAQGPKDDPDGDGWNNAREQIRGTNPTVANDALAIDLSVWNQNFLRLSWPAAAGTAYPVGTFTGSTPTATTLTNVSGKFPVTELFVPYTNSANRFFFLQPNTP